MEELEQRCARLEQQLHAKPSSDLPKPVMRFLMKAAHPDRHQNSEEATQALQWLLAFRERANT